MDARKDDLLGELGLAVVDSIEDAREDYVHGKIEVDEFERRIAAVIVDEPDTGRPPCDFCRREVPCECSTTAEREAGDETCMCTCGRCMAPYPWEVGQ